MINYVQWCRLKEMAERLEATNLRVGTGGAHGSLGPDSPTS